MLPAKPASPVNTMADVDGSGTSTELASRKPTSLLAY
ncbi:MAG: hypothetical protein RLZZ326_3623, partial [Planctomycetota bacterium]